MLVGSIMDILHVIFVSIYALRSTAIKHLIIFTRGCTYASTTSLRLVVSILASVVKCLLIGYISTRICLMNVNVSERGEITWYPGH